MTEGLLVTVELHKPRPLVQHHTNTRQCIFNTNTLYSPSPGLGIQANHTHTHTHLTGPLHNTGSREGPGRIQNPHKQWFHPPPYVPVMNFSPNPFLLTLTQSLSPPSFILLNKNPLSLFLCTLLLFPWLLPSLLHLSLPPSVSLSASLTPFLSFSFGFHLCLPSCCCIPGPSLPSFYLTLFHVLHLSFPFKLPFHHTVSCFTYRKKVSLSAPSSPYPQRLPSLTQRPLMLVTSSNVMPFPYDAI